MPLSFINILKLNRNFNGRPHKLFAFALSVYFENHNKKKFHATLTVCAALNDGIIRYKEVTIEERDGKYRSIPQSLTDIYISERFEY